MRREGRILIIIELSMYSVSICAVSSAVTSAKYRVRRTDDVSHQFNRFSSPTRTVGRVGGGKGGIKRNTTGIAI